MPAQSKSQQRFFGVVKAMQKGDIPKKGRAGKIAKTMDKDDVDDFASTKHKGKPEKVKREQRVKNLIKKMVREELDETTVRISPMKDVSFAGRDRLQLLGKKGKLGLDRKSVSALVKAVRSILGRSFTTHEGKLNEAKTITLPNGVKAKIEFKGITLQAKGKKPVFLDRTEMMTFFKATQKYMKQGLAAGKMSEEKLTEKIGKGISFDNLKLGNTVKYTMGMDYKVVKLSSSKATLQLIHTLKNVNKSMFAKKFDISKRDFDNAILDRQIRFITRGSAKVNEGTCGYGENGELGEEPAGPHLIKKKKIKEKKLNEKMDAKKAKTILQQLGANRFIAMTGAKNFAFDSKYMSFKIGRNSKGINHVRIAHNAKDLYDMEFGFNSVKGYKVKKKVKDVYADMLSKIFQKYTGMRTRL